MSLKRGAKEPELWGSRRSPAPSVGAAMVGFGTSALLSRVSRRDSMRLLETALDEGITHLDTARSYGFGEAELVVGAVLAGRRECVTLTTKVGILPPRRSPGLTAAKAMARGLLRVFPGARAPLRQRAGGLVRAGHFDCASMAESLYTSLRHLRTDYVDFLLLHEPSPEVLTSEEALDFMRQMQHEGKVRAFGMAGSGETAAFALQHAPAYAAVLQVPQSVFAPGVLSLVSDAGSRIFTHSALGARFGELRAALQADPEMARRWSEELDLDMRAQGQLARLALLWSRTRLPHATLLFASINQAHIREDAAALRTAAPAKQLQSFEQLVGQWRRIGDFSAEVSRG